MSKRSEKAKWLVQAAKELFHQQGFYQTTLADIALKAKVPLGNIYYYFKTKEELGSAVLSDKKIELIKQLALLNEQPHPFIRLKSFVERSFQDTDELARFGSANGSLAEEFNRHMSPLAAPARELFHMLRDWVKEQFIALNLEEEKADQRALRLLATLQGVKGLALCFQDPLLPERITNLVIEDLAA